jgi:class 3 adenylate cyclase
MAATTPIHFEAQRLPWTRSAGERVEMTLLCADIVGFTEMLSRLGDAGALAVMRGVASTVRAHARRYGGELLEIRGDAFLLAFSSPRRAMPCAIRTIRALAFDRDAHGGEAVRVRMALHSGDVLRDGNGYFGRSLILAYRLLSQVGAGTIALTTAAAAQLPARWRARAASSGCFRPKGFGCEVRYLLLGALRFGARDGESGIRVLN